MAQAPVPAGINAQIGKAFTSGDAATAEQMADSPLETS
jgi:hypothetical protein